MDPNTLNLDPDPDPEFWSNVYPDPGSELRIQGYVINFEEKK